MGQFMGCSALARVLAKKLTGARALWPKAKPIGLFFGFGFAALVEPVAFAVHFKDMNMMGQSVEDGTGEAL